MKIKVDGRELEFPAIDTLTFREAKLIKLATGLRMGEYQDAFTAGDPDALIGLALVAVKRADGNVDQNTLLDMPITKLEVVADEPVEVDEPEVPLDVDVDVTPASKKKNLK